jgi:DNA-binding SARP family transcriptional activator
VILLRSLGNAEIETGVTTLTPSQEVVFAAALYMVLERGKRISRNRLASLLWPNVPEKARAHRLRQTVLQLKKLGIRLVADRDNLQLPKEDARSDSDDLALNHPALSTPQPSLEFLPGYTPRLSEGLRDWIDAKRTEVHAAATSTLVHELERARLRADWTGVERTAAACLALDAYNETAILAQAEATAMRGSKRAALAILDEYVADIGHQPEIKLPPQLLRKRIAARIPENQDRLTNEPRFVGRQAELAFLLQNLRAAKDGVATAVVVAGVAGIGKTRLLFELARFAALEGIQVHRVVCRRSDANQPLAAIIDLIPGLKEVPGALGCSRETLECLKRLTDLSPTPSGDDGASVDSGSDLRRAIFDLIDAISEECCVLILVEDIQWLDSASAALLANLVERCVNKRVMCVLNSRDEENPLTAILGKDRIKIVNLQGLPRAAASHLVSDILDQPQNRVRGADVDWLIDAGDGNPFFLQELAKHWAETGKRDELPPSVSKILDARLGRLTLLGSQVLQTCALLGEDSNLDRVGRVLEYPSHDLLYAIEELTIAGMLRAAPKESNFAVDKLLTRHDLVSTAALDRLGSNATAFLHRRCGVVLEQEIMGSNVSIGLLRSCAFHWSNSGAPDRAYSLAIKCANHLLDVGLAADAAAAFEGALAYCTTIELKVDLLERIVRSLALAREWYRVLQMVGETRALRASAGLSVNHDNLEPLEFEALRRTASNADDIFRRTLYCVYDKRLPAGHRVEAASHALKIGTAIANLAEMPAIYSAVQELLVDPSVDSRARLSVELVYNTMCGDLTAALRQAQVSVETERARDVPSDIIGALGNLAFVLLRTGPIEQALAALTEGYNTACRCKLLPAVSDMAARIAAISVDWHRQDAQERVKEALQANEASPDPHIAFSLTGLRAKLAIEEKRFTEANEIISEQGKDEWLQPRHGFHAAQIAIRIRAMIGRCASVEETAPYVETLAGLFYKVAGLGGQDYEVASLYFGLTYLKRRRAAEAYVFDYLKFIRREIYSPSPELMVIARSIAQRAGANLHSKSAGFVVRDPNVGSVTHTL